MKSLSEIAKSFIGIKEIGNNEGFNDKNFNELMQSVGFAKGESWCALFAMICIELYLTQFDSSAINILRKKKLLDKSAVKTYNNIKTKYPAAIVLTPTKNTIAIWQQYKENKQDWRGHEAIVLSLENTVTLTTIDGNTNIKGSREGDGVYEKTRHLNLKPITGLRFKGFISIDILIECINKEINA